MIDQATVDRIIDAAQIVDVVSEFVTLRKRGVNYVGLCPFHNEKLHLSAYPPPKVYANVSVAEKVETLFILLWSMNNYLTMKL
jgi:DNA primase (bacterial type)